jgi:hypothetical protein
MMLKSWFVANYRLLPGWAAKSLMILFTALSAFWGAGEMYHEGWWGRWYNPLLYLIPAVLFMALTLVSLRWPRVGGGAVILFGMAAGFFFHTAIGGMLIAAIGVLFWFEGRRAGRAPASRWWFRLVVVPGILFIAGFSAFRLPVVLSRVDDGNRAARRVAGNGVELVWAPAGPGWNWQQPWGGYPSWNAIALYGLAPVGPDWQDKPGYGQLEDGSWRHASGEDMARNNLCLYLGEDGLTLMDEPQYIWRMPTVDEYVRSFARHGENAGCEWNGELGRPVTCEVRPDKETPLWAPDLAPIYYWAAEAYNDQDAFFVSYNGFVNATRKLNGNPRHSHRCVREVD